MIEYIKPNFSQSVLFYYFQLTFSIFIQTKTGINKTNLKSVVFTSTIIVSLMKEFIYLLSFKNLREQKSAFLFPLKNFIEENIMGIYDIVVARMFLY